MDFVEPWKVMEKLVVVQEEALMKLGSCIRSSGASQVAGPWTSRNHSQGGRKEAIA